MSNSQHETHFLENFNKALDTIFTLGTGAFALSITFRSEIAGTNPSASWVLSLAWICLATSSISYVLLRIMMSCVFLDFGISQTRIEQKLNDLKMEYEKSKCDADSKLVTATREEKIAILEELVRLNSKHRETIDALDIKPQDSGARLAADYLYKVCLLAFLAGIISLLLFAVVNNHAGNTSSDAVERTL